MTASRGLCTSSCQKKRMFSLFSYCERGPDQQVLDSVNSRAIRHTLVDPGINRRTIYNCDVLLKRDLLVDIKQFSDFNAPQRDSAPATELARQTQETLDFISPAL